MTRYDLGKLAAWFHPCRLQNPISRVLLVHGISEHSGRHLTTVAALNEAGFEVVRFDLRGSGQSGGRRQWIDKFSDYVDDVSQVFHWSQTGLPARATFLLGHSLGGLIALYFASEFGTLLQGLVLSAPAVFTGNDLPAWKIRAGKALARLLPTLPIPNTGDFSGVSRDPSVVEAYKSDPLAFHFNTLRQGDEVLKAMDLALQVAKNIKIPSLVVHGTSDKIIRFDGSYDLLNALGSSKKQWLILPNGAHEPHNDLDQEFYFQQLTFWLKRHATNSLRSETTPRLQPTV